METSKVALGMLGATGVTGGGGFAAYKMGVFSGEEKPLSVEQRLNNEEYELINSEDKRKEIFKDLKDKTEFLNELNKYKEGTDNLSDDNDGTKGGPALKKMCDALLGSKEEQDFKNASEWCVLRIQDRVLSNKSWIPLSGSEDHSSDWKASFTANQNAMVAYGVEGIQTGMQADNGYTKVKEWCSKNAILPINKSRKTLLEKASIWCTKNS
ncbi:hypothetical protein HF1_08320 [Mycoplasma haemofelis str. Langford 1]|uniref:Uncharacterized protein n=2 Tax=Mycoplasma haemofelis TaxID=29501 RepID=F6FIX2_MYCHI|nr:hypothetical protein [Mycoplasma haemofelis]AEG73170.1 hypothetical protein MHF_0913 [Mycoplasma haemofelis Ohio2]CBY92840.1 hypothetical protein HF1_08320 [Mycoplasma haemofelis str. Langford 1]